MEYKKPLIKPVEVKEYIVKQSKYKIAPSLPIRSIILGPSGSGKSVLLQSMILDIYRGSFDQIYIFSPSVHVDDAIWEPVRKYIDEKINLLKEKVYFDHYDHNELDQIIETQKKVIQYQKLKKHKKLHQILIIIDDMADSSEFCRHSKLLHSLYIRGRHICCSVITSVQKYSCLSTIARVNATSVFIFRLRSWQDLQTWLDETAALLKNKDALYELYKLAIEDSAYSFLYLDLTSKDINKTFYIRFDKVMKIKD